MQHYRKTSHGFGTLAASCVRKGAKLHPNVGQSLLLYHGQNCSIGIPEMHYQQDGIENPPGYPAYDLYAL